MPKLTIEIDGTKYENELEAYVDGVRVPVTRQDILRGKLELAEGSHGFRIERVTSVSGRGWLMQFVLLFMIGIFGSNPPDLEKGVIYNSVLRGEIHLIKDETLQIFLSDSEEGAFHFDNDVLTATENRTYRDTRLEKRRNVAKGIMWSVLGLFVAGLAALIIALVVNK